jgi:hypothetical protein
MVPRGGRKAGLHLTSRELRLAVAPGVTSPGELYLCTPNAAPNRLHLGRLLITHCLVIRPTW